MRRNLSNHTESAAPPAAHLSAAQRARTIDIARSLQKLGYPFGRRASLFFPQHYLSSGAQPTFGSNECPFASSQSMPSRTAQLPRPTPPPTSQNAQPSPRGQLDFGISEDLSACVPVRQTSSAKRRLRVTAKSRPNHHRSHLPSYHPSPPGGPLRDRLLLLLLGAPLLTAPRSSANMAVASHRIVRT